MRRLHLCAGFIAAAIQLGMLSSPAHAQEGGPGARIARFTDAQTIAVVRIDLERLELPTAESLLEGLPVNEANRGRIEAMLERCRLALAGWKELGASEAFYVVSLADLPSGGGGFLVLPGVDSVPGGDRPAVTEAPGGCEIIAGALVCANPDTIKRLKQHADGLVLPAAAFEAVQDDPVQAIVAPSDDQRRVLREMAPALPAELGGLSGEALADGVLWAAVGVKLTPRPTARAIVHSRDAAAAERLQRAIEGGLRAAAQHPQARQHLPDIDRLIQRLIPRVENDRLVLSQSTDDPLIRSLLSQLLLAAGHIQQGGDRRDSMNNLKQLGLAMHNFHDAHGSFPPSASYDANCKPLLSWRVYVLPYVDAMPLYQEFRLNEPWDSEHNKRLIAKMPAAFASPLAPEAAREGKTPYLAPIGETVAFSGKEAGLPVSEFSDGLSNTILVLEVPPDEAVVWTKPDDWEVNLDQPQQGLFPEGRDGAFALFADGSVRFISKVVDPESLKGQFTRKANDVIKQE